MTKRTSRKPKKRTSRRNTGWSASPLGRRPRRNGPPDAASHVRRLGGRVRFSDRSKLMDPAARRHGLRWTAFVSVWGHDVAGDGATKALAVEAALHELPAHLARHFGAQPPSRVNGYGRSYSGDPRWMSARFDGIDDEGNKVRKGDEVLYWPSTKRVMTGQKAKDAWQRFLSEKGDEEGTPYARNPRRRKRTSRRNAGLWTGREREFFLRAGRKPAFSPFVKKEAKAIVDGISANADRYEADGDYERFHEEQVVWWNRASEDYTVHAEVLRLLREKPRRNRRRLRANQGERVQLHPGTDRWMMGDRFGNVTSVRKKDGAVRVKLDRSGKSLWFRPQDVMVVW